MAKIHDRYLEILVTTNNGAQTCSITKVNYYRSKAELDAAQPFTLTGTYASAAASPADAVMGELVPPPTIIRVTATINA